MPTREIMRESVIIGQPKQAYQNTGMKSQRLEKFMSFDFAPTGKRGTVVHEPERPSTKEWTFAKQVRVRLKTTILVQQNILTSFEAEILFLKF